MSTHGSTAPSKTVVPVNYLSPAKKRIYSGADPADIQPGSSAASGSSTPASPSARDPFVAEMLDGLKEIERLRALFARLLYAVEAGRVGPGGLRMMVRQVCADALNLDELPDEAIETTVLDAPPVPPAIPAPRRLGLPAPARRLGPAVPAPRIGARTRR